MLHGGRLLEPFPAEAFAEAERAAAAAPLDAADRVRPRRMCIVGRRPDAAPPLAPRDRGEDGVDRRDVHFAAAHRAPVQNPQIVGVAEQVAHALVVALDVGHAAPLIGPEDVHDGAGDESHRVRRR